MMGRGEGIMPWRDKGTERQLSADFYPDADLLEILPMALLLHPAILALGVGCVLSRSSSRCGNR
jgi:hypothetical protein